jgi:ABC-type nitrate/sulfonate/bicarbonate transport system ATPase subunit
VFLSSRVAVFSPRPARCERLVTVDLPRPRRWATLASNPRMGELREELLELLHTRSPAAVGGSR